MPDDPIALLLVSNGCPLPESVATLLDNRRFRATTVDHLSQVDDDLLATELDAALVLNTSQEDGERAVVTAEANRLAERFGPGRVGVVLMTPDENGEQTSFGAPANLEAIGPGTSSDELLGRLSTMARYRPVIRRLEHELNNMQRLGRRLNHHFTEIDQEMRLASRLQRDFLPQETPAVGGIRLATIFRPASWVSGDIYDVFRIDESNIGMYVADAVGHGMAAGLLTMFIKRAIVPKRIYENGYEVVPPGEVLAHLNETLRGQNLPNCQFVTACYCTYDCESRELKVARGGHPYPIRIGTNGSLTEIRSAGGLLGVFGGEEFETVSTRLEPGEKLLLYSDGIEMAFLEGRGTSGAEPRYKQEFETVSHLPTDELIRRLGAMLDAEEGSLHPPDDVTVIVLEIPT